ncbi:MAG: hypothetical protein IK024_04745 [Treponema sp.]|nr:hypothetical protein [Treponema sp.]
MQNPVGNQVMKKVTDSFEISFKPFESYEFICWKIIDSASGTELKNGDFLFIDSPTSENTTCSFNKKPSDGMELCISVVLAERPSVISKYPETANVIRESVITVDFDYEMNTDSIYFTTDEYDRLKDSVTFFEPVTLPDGTQRYYKYKIGNEIYFKNIKITNKKTGDNLLSLFDAPTFENNNITLIIPPKKSSPPVSYTSLLVCIEAGFFYTANSSGYEKDVQMKEFKKWSYTVNNQTDKFPLVTDKFTLKINNTSKTSKKFTKVSDLKNDFIKNNKFQIALDISVEENSDGQSGPDTSFWMKVEKVKGKNYQNASSSRDIQIIYSTVDSLKASYTGTIDLLKTKAKEIIDEGVYAISFTFKDKAGNDSTYPSDGKKYYFAIDKTGISEKPVLTSISFEDKVYRDFCFSWSEPTAAPDFAQLYYSFKKVGATEVETSNNTVTSYIIKKFEYDALYEVTLKYIDYAGNVGEAATFYIRSDAIASIPTKITNYSGSYDGGTYCKFGNYPQSLIDSTNVSLYPQDKICLDWYLGTDGYFYEKYNGNYYKYEPIIWRVIGDSNSNNVLLVSEKILTADVPFYDGPNQQRNNEGVTYYPNDYEVSTIRAFLNGLSYPTLVPVSNLEYMKDINSLYYNKGFLQKAFVTTTATNTILNSSVSFKAYRKNNNDAEICTLENEKIFLLKNTDDLGSEYSYAKKTLTAYAQATNSTADGSWWLNNAFHDNRAWNINETSSHNKDYFVDSNGITTTVEITRTVVQDEKPGVVPALYINASNLQEASN